MVTRKALPDNADMATTQPQEHAPSSSSESHLNPEDVPTPLRPTANYADMGDSNVWDDLVPNRTSTDGNRTDGEVNRVPTVLRPGAGRVNEINAAATAIEHGEGPNRIPTVLRPGGGHVKTETNPFKRKILTNTTGGSISSENSFAPSTSAPPVPSLPVDAFSQLNVADQSTNPWQPALERTDDPSPPPHVPKLLDQETDIWDSGKLSRQPTPGPASTPPAVVSLPSEEGSAAWGEESKKSSLPTPPPIPSADNEAIEGSHAWDDLGTVDKGKAPAQIPSVPTNEGWNLIDIDTRPAPPSRRSTWDDFDEVEERRPSATTNDRAASPEPPRDLLTDEPAQSSTGAPPSLPPRSTGTAPPPQPPRPADKSETYQIKKINWHDVNAANNPRVSPILVQNANGPCPLVALVNALSLTTPAEKPNTALVGTLRSREQVSLGLLLEAVFEELMSERRMRSDTVLPDVGELYEFLQGLHTGMNVNPRFIPTDEVVSAFKRTSLTHLHPTERGNLIPGTFEDTKEMALYSTFSIPLIHGWLPAPEDAVTEAFARQAASYEDTQNLLFREEELEEKLSSSSRQGLTEEEQQIYQDILTIKSFLSISATQLTPWGLNVIKKSMKPGSVAILFRNDHFSTLYRHPQTLELLTLVTDAGYAGHDEVVWESLVDVNGERAEFFSGDFLLVGGALHGHQQNSDNGSGARSYAAAANASSSRNGGGGNGGGSWTTVEGRRGRSGQSQGQSSGQGSSSDGPQLSPSHEQEDRDLALALQLQEEEEERHRAELERRRRESMLSEQFIEQQARTNGPSGGAGRGSRGGHGRGGGSTSSLGRGGSRISLGSSATNGPAAPARRSSNSVNIPPTPATPRAGATTGVRPQGQTVRSLIPPAQPRTNRAADEGLDDAPPSYEQAAKQTPYEPPAGHPAHPSSSTLASNDGSGRGTRLPPLVPPRESGTSVNRTASSGFPSGPAGPGTPGANGRLRPGVPVPATPGGTTRERDCIVM